jgi:hypothetical protein
VIDSHAWACVSYAGVGRAGAGHRLSGTGAGVHEEWEREGWFQFGVAGELIKRHGEDQRAFLQALAQLFQAALPDATTIEQRGGWFAKKTLHRLTVDLGEQRYTLEDPGSGPLQAFRTRVVRGIALRTEAIPIDEWVGELGAALEASARTSAAVREALAKMTGSQ